MYSLLKGKSKPGDSKESLLLKVHSLEMAIRECNTVNAIQAVNKHVQAAITMPNANSERQTTFFSTKKRRQTPTTLSKPSRQDRNQC